ncbi:MAG: hypothetical protein JXC32_00710 [Anaerolineae bacterium]|nr:hypothetical protein [Anaerolineae bacterium]
MYPEPRPGPMPSLHPSRWSVVLTALLLLIASLACLNTHTAFRITPTEERAAEVHLAYTQMLTEGYIEAARRANADLRQDYAQAGQPAPEGGFPESWTEIAAVSQQQLPDPDLVITETGSRGYTAEASYQVDPSSDAPEGWALTIGDVDEDGVQRFDFEMKTLEASDDFDYVELARSLEAPMPPKPPVPAEDAGGGDDGLGGLFSGLTTLMNGELAEADLNGWYMWRILKEAGIPVFTYEITMPGQVTAHTIDGQTAGTLDDSGSTVTLVIDDDFIRTFGLTGAPFHVQSEVNQCEAQCSTMPHMLWDKSAPGPGCTCICETGYESNDSGDCVACAQVCAAYDPHAVHDPGDSQPNRCGCTCIGDLMTFAWGETGGACRCVGNAVLQGDDCVCAAGYVKSLDGLSCVLASEVVEPVTNCPAGTNCLLNPDQCRCTNGMICDPIAQQNNVGLGDPETYCAGKVAYVMISSELTPYERQWIHGKISAIRSFFTNAGYTTFTVLVYSPGQVVELIAPPSTQAIAYFGHAIEPAIEDIAAGTLRNDIFTWLQKQYAARGSTPNDAFRLSDPRGKNLGLQFAYMHTCHSADNMSLRDYLVRSGGTYWGETGLLFAPQSLTRYPRP